MTLSKLLAALLLLLSGVSAQASQTGRPIGFVDLLTAQAATGWACMTDDPLPVSVAAYAGTALLGIYPANVNRPDLAGLCAGGGTRHGFAIWFDRTAQAQFYGQGTVSILAAGGGGVPVLLPGSTPRVTNPFPIPQGALQAIDGSGTVTGWVAYPGALPPPVSLYAGAPPNEGGVFRGYASATTSAPGELAFALAQSGSNPGVPLFGYAGDGAGDLVPLLDAIPQPDGGSAVPLALSYRVQQAGTHTGILNTIFTTWLAPGTAFGGLSGTIALNGNVAAFSEALVTLGSTGDEASACLARNGVVSSVAPVMSRLWSGILKSNGTATVSAPVNFALSHGVAIQGAGSGICLATLVSAGYPFLDHASARYTTTTTTLQAWLVPTPRGAPDVLSLGLGGEFRFVTGGAVPLSTYVGIKASRPLWLDGIAGWASVAAVAGAPLGTPWVPAPVSLWGMDTTLTYLPASACAEAGFKVQQSNGIYAIIRQPNPAQVALPQGTRTLLDLPLAGAGAIPLQRNGYRGFADPTNPGGSTLLLNAGDCLIGFYTLQPAAGAGAGALDFEDQSTVFLRLGQ